MKNFDEIEKAFQQIRASTGNSDVKEMVEKFMYRDNVYAQLLQKVSENEKLYEELKQQNELKRERLRQLKIDNDTRKKVGGE